MFSLVSSILQFLLIPAIPNFIMMMHSSLYSSAILLLLLVGSATTTVFAFAPPSSPCIVASHVSASPSTVVLHSEVAATMADSGKPPSSATSDINIADVEFPTKLPSDVGMDYVPLATMLATGQLAEADQVRQDRPTIGGWYERGAWMCVCVCNYSGCTIRFGVLRHLFSYPREPFTVTFSL